MKLNTMNLLATALAIVLTLSSAQTTQVTGTCSSDMTKFDSTPQGFDSILINPTCSSGEMLTTSQLAWTIEPTTDAEASIYSYPPNAVTVSLKENVLLFDLADLGVVPEKAGVVIQVPVEQLKDVTVDGIMNHVRIARGFPYLMSVNSLGMSGVLQADLTDSPYAHLTVDTTNSIHVVAGENLNLAMFAVSTTVHITGSVLGGSYAGFSNELLVDGEVRDLWMTGNQNMLASSDCSSVVVDSYSSTCTIMDSEEMPTDIPSVPCTFPGCEKTCTSTASSTCSCTEEECLDTVVMGQQTADDGGTSSSAASTGLWVVVAVSAFLAVITTM